MTMLENDRRVPLHIGEEYGWDWQSQVNVPMLRHTLKCLRNIIDNPSQFPNADREKVLKRWEELFDFLVVNMCDVETIRSK